MKEPGARFFRMGVVNFYVAIILGILAYNSRFLLILHQYAVISYN